jgi:hypothetical protein
MRAGKVDSEKLLAMAKALNAYAKSQPDVQARIGDGTELVLELGIEKGNINIIKSCGYYFVDHVERVIFWAHPYICEPGGEILFNVKAARKYSHISGWFTTARIAFKYPLLEYSIESQYWLVVSKELVRSVNILDQFC